MLKRFILWDFPRGGWQYDVMVGLILAFLFLTPRAWFRDQPRTPHASGIAVLPSEHGTSVFFADKELLEGVAPERWNEAATKAIRAKHIGDSRLIVNRVEPIRNAEGELQGYSMIARP